jgi:hypothetical protein
MVANYFPENEFPWAYARSIGGRIKVRFRLTNPPINTKINPSTERTLHKERAMDNSTSTSKHKSSSPLPGILLLLGTTAITFILCSLLQSSRNTRTPYQQILWEFTRYEKVTSLTTAIKDICLLDNAVHDAMGHKNLPQLVHVLAVHENKYLKLTRDYEEHYSNGLRQHFIESNSEQAPSLDDIKQMTCN